MPHEQMRFELFNRIELNADDDKKRRASEIERHIESRNQYFRQETDQRKKNRASQTGCTPTLDRLTSGLQMEMG